MIHVCEGCVCHFLKCLNRISNFDAERSDILVEGGHLRIEALHGFSDVRRLLLYHLLVQLLVGNAFRNDSLVALNANRTIIGARRSRLLGFLLERNERLTSVK